MIIGLSGIARSGKDTFGEMLAKQLGYQTYAYAKPLKHYVNYIFGWDERCSDGVLKEERIYTKGTTRYEVADKLSLFQKYIQRRVDYKVPELDQFIVDFGRVFSPYAMFNKEITQWCISPRKAYQLFGTEFGRECISESLWTDIAPKNNVVITDVRFQNEADSVLKQKGKLIRIERSDQKTISESGHASESGFNAELLATVQNDGTLDDLKKKATLTTAILRGDDECLSNLL